VAAQLHGRVGGAVVRAGAAVLKLILRREPKQPSAKCTLGLLFLGDLSLVTIERPWVPTSVSKGGTKGVSCVPCGTYQLVRHNTDGHPMSFALVNHELDVAHYDGEDTNPAARTAVLIHSANYVHELRGCIAPGTRTEIDAKFGYCVRDSRKAMGMLNARLPWTDGHIIEISESL
jgi:hypothetical protein